MMKSNDSEAAPALTSLSPRAVEDPGSEASVIDIVRALPGWYLADRRRTLGVKYRFSEHPQALAFLSKVTELAGEHGASPHLVLTSGGQLHLRLRSRQQGGVGADELAFARAVAAHYPEKTLGRARLSRAPSRA